jgi:hypothetical protein
VDITAKRMADGNVFSAYLGTGNQIRGYILKKTGERESFPAL